MSCARVDDEASREIEGENDGFQFHIRMDLCFGLFLQLFHKSTVTEGLRQSKHII